MKHSIVYLLFIVFLCNPFVGFTQDSTSVANDLNEVNLLKFQDYFFKALAQKSIFNYSVAIENLEKCNELKPNDKSVLFELSKNNLELKKFFEAEQYIKQALLIEPKNYWMLTHLLKIYTTSNNIQSAIAIQEQLVVLNPKEKEKLVYLYVQNNELDKANTILLELKKENTITPKMIDFESQFLKKTEKKETSSPLNLQGLIKDFESNKSFESLEKILTLLAENNDALLLEYSKTGLELFPAQPIMYLMSAKALNQKKKFKEAIEQLNNGIDFVIDNSVLEASFYDELAIGYSGLGNEKEAIKNKNKALALRKK